MFYFDRVLVMGLYYVYEIKTKFFLRSVFLITAIKPVKRVYIKLINDIIVSILMNLEETRLEAPKSIYRFGIIPRDCGFVHNQAQLTPSTLFYSPLILSVMHLKNRVRWSCTSI
jgi:hypothetical protein